MDPNRTPDGGICSNCGQIRPLASLLAFWPVDRPLDRRFVCRPLDSIPPFMSCFRDIVGTTGEHAIAPATEVAA